MIWWEGTDAVGIANCNAPSVVLATIAAIAGGRVVPLYVTASSLPISLLPSAPSTASPSQPHFIVYSLPTSTPQSIAYSNFTTDPVTASTVPGYPKSYEV